MCLSFARARRNNGTFISRYHSFILKAKSRLKEFLYCNAYVKAASCVFFCSRVRNNGIWVFKNINERALAVTSFT